MPGSSQLGLRTQFARSIAQGDPALRLYAILDAQSCQRRGLDLLMVAKAWKEAGVAVVQYRDKVSPKPVIEARVTALRAIFPRDGSTLLLMNDLCDVAASCGLDGVHVGQSDTSVEHARSVLGEDALIGISTHSPDQAAMAERSDCDYVAIGPVYATMTKADAEPVVGLCGVQAARALVRKPLVAIGGIGFSEANGVRHAGADMIAVISALLAPSEAQSAVHPEALSEALAEHARDFLRRLK